MHPIYMPAAPVRDAGVRDTTGAGDCFTGYLVAGLMQRYERGAPMGEAEMTEMLRRCVQVSPDIVLLAVSYLLLRSGCKYLCRATWRDGQHPIGAGGRRTSYMSGLLLIRICANLHYILSVYFCAAEKNKMGVSETLQSRRRSHWDGNHDLHVEEVGR